MPNKFHLGWFVDGFRIPAWNQPWAGASSAAWQTGEFYVEMARDLERAGFDFVMLEDSNYIPDNYGGTTETYLKYGQRAPKHDPAVLAAMIAALTNRIGIICTVATTEITPFRLARLIQTLDNTSGGRIGWNVVTGSNDLAAQNFGHDKQPEHDRRYDMADEMIQAVRQLWLSWEDGAVALDEESGVYVDHTKVHPINFEGEHFKTRGPLNVLPGPQKQPVLLQAGLSPRGQRFAARNADCVIATGGDIAGMKQLRDNIRDAAAEVGRNPDDVKVLFLLEPILGETDAEAIEKARRLKEENQDRLDLVLSGMASVTTTDFKKLDLDEPLPADLTTNGHAGTLDAMVKSGKTLRELMLGTMEGAADVAMVGTPATVAKRMGDVMDQVGGDGFLITTWTPTKRYIAEIADGLVPELQKLGLARTEYEFSTVKDNLKSF